MRWWTTVMVAAVLAPSAATAGQLADDVAATCAHLETDGLSTTAAALQGKMLGQMLSCNRVDRVYSDEAVLTDPKLQKKRFAKQKPAMRGDAYAFLDARYRLSQLERLMVAQRFVTEKPDAGRVAKRFGAGVLFCAAHEAIDPAALDAELAADPRVVGRTAEVLRVIYALQKEQHGAWMTLRQALAQRAPVLAGFFDTAVKRLAQYQADFDGYAPLGAAIRAGADAIFSGKAPAASACEGPILAAWAQHRGLPHEHPLVASAATVMAGCAAARGDEALAAAFAGMPPNGRKALGPLRAVLDDLNAEIVARVAAGKTTPELRPATELRYVVPDPMVSMSGLGSHLMPAEGPVKITGVTKVTYKGLPFVLVEGLGQQVTVPVMACSQVQMGWQVGNGKVEPRMGSSCSFTGKVRKENLLFTPVLVPEVYAASLRPGRWARFKRFDAKHSADRGLITPAPKHGDTGIFFGAPVLMEDTLVAFTKDETKMQRWNQSVVPLTD